MAKLTDRELLIQTFSALNIEFDEMPDEEDDTIHTVFIDHMNGRICEFKFDEDDNFIEVADGEY